MIPNSQHRLIVGDKVDPVWLRFLQSLDGKANASDISAIATALGSPDGTVANIPDLSANTVRILQGAGIAVTRDDAGAYAIALRPLGDSGAGTFKLITRDSTGRISGSLDGTAADVPYDPATSGLAATDVQAAIDELAEEKLDDAPSDGDEYVRKDGAWAVASASVGGAMTLVGTATVAGSAVTDLTLSGLDLDTDGRYVVWMSLGNATVSSASISMYYSGDTTATNYYVQFWNVDGTAVGGAARSNAAVIAAMNASSVISGQAELMVDPFGYTRSTVRLNRHAPSAVVLVHDAHIWASASNVTSITLSSSVANALAVGSYFKVYKLD